VRFLLAGPRVFEVSRLSMLPETLRIARKRLTRPLRDFPRPQK